MSKSSEYCESGHEIFRTLFRSSFFNGRSFQNTWIPFSSKWGGGGHNLLTSWAFKHTFKGFNSILMLLIPYKSLIRIALVINLLFNLFHTTSWAVISILRFLLISNIVIEDFSTKIWMLTDSSGNPARKQLFLFTLPNFPFPLDFIWK